MNKNPFAPAFSDLPQTLPIFPLDGILVLPGGKLPLNVFEPQYKAMVEHALATNRLIGIIQPKNTSNNEEEIYDIGCAGKITEFSETEDGRYEIALIGVCRFCVDNEKDTKNGFRQVVPDWSNYANDLAPKDCLGINRDELRQLLEKYFDQEGMNCEWEHFYSVSDNRLMTCLSMICPMSSSEKQALLEAKCCKSRSEMFMQLIEMAAYGQAASS